MDVLPLPSPVSQVATSTEDLRARQRDILRALNGQNYTNIDLAASLALHESPTLTIVSGVIDVARHYGPYSASYGMVKVETQGGFATDDLETINGGRDGQILFIRPANIAHTIVVKNATLVLPLRNIAINRDIVLDDDTDVLPLIYSAPKLKWLGLLSLSDYSFGGAALSISDGGVIAHGMTSVPSSVSLTGTVAGEIVTATSVDINYIYVAIKKPGAASSAGDHDHPIPVGSAGGHTHAQSSGIAQTIYWRAWP